MIDVRRNWVPGDGEDENHVPLVTVSLQGENFAVMKWKWQPKMYKTGRVAAKQVRELVVSWCDAMRKHRDKEKAKQDHNALAETTIRGLYEYFKGRGLEARLYDKWGGVDGPFLEVKTFRLELNIRFSLPQGYDRLAVTVNYPNISADIDTIRAVIPSM